MFSPMPRVVPGLPLLTAGACVLLISSISPARQPPEGGETGSSDFIRLSRTEDGELKSLDVAICRFVAPSGAVVDLISAVHIGEGSYYAELNRRFRDYDAVLYELIAPEGTRIQPGQQDRRSPVSFLQGGMTSLLEMEFQLEAIDYTRENLLHADMSPKEFAESMQDRGESMLQMLMRMWGKAIAQQNHGDAQKQEVQLLAALLSKDRAGKLKQVLAEQFVNMDDMMDLYTGKNGSTLVTERNKKALKVLRQQLRKGRQRLAIFYGAGHMSDFAERLSRDFKMRRVKIEWIPAWNLTLAEQKTTNPKRD